MLKNNLLELLDASFEDTSVATPNAIEETVVAVEVIIHMKFQPGFVKTGSSGHLEAPEKDQEFKVFY